MSKKTKPETRSARCMECKKVMQVPKWAPPIVLCENCHARLKKTGDLKKLEKRLAPTLG